MIAAGYNSTLNLNPKVVVSPFIINAALTTAHVSKVSGKVRVRVNSDVAPVVNRPALAVEVVL